MKKKMMRVACLLLAVIIMLCPLSVCIATSTPEPYPTPNVPDVLGSDELMRSLIYYYVWETLNSWGIHINLVDFADYTGVIDEWIQDRLEEWLETVPSINSIDALLFPWKFVWNPSGYLVGNHSALDDIRQFGNWLQSKYGFTDNDEIQVTTTGGTLGEMVVYSLPLVFRPVNNQGLGYDVIAITSADSIYGLFQIDGTEENLALTCICKTVGQARRDIVLMDDGTTSSSYTVNIRSLSGNWYVGNAGLTLNIENYGLEYIQYYTYQQIQTALSTHDTVTPYGDSLFILTDSVNIPTAEEITDNSIVITPSGPLYEPVEWNGTVTVDNLPAIVSTGTVDNPGIQSVFLPIKSFINTFEDGFGLMTQLVYNLPSEIVGMALAIMGAIIIFGTIKIMKEH